MTNYINIKTEQNKHLVSISTQRREPISVSTAVKETSVDVVSNQRQPTVPVSISSQNFVEVEVATNEVQTFIPVGEGELYTGKYNITPNAKTHTVLETAGKTLMKDITVFKIPKYEVANSSGGETIYIASGA